jgi:hypothetical protein
MRLSPAPTIPEERHRGTLIRNRGYALFSTGLAATFLGIMLMAVVDPNTPALGQPAWGWTLLASVLALGTRAWFIGLRVTEQALVRHGWLRNRTIARQRIVGVGSANYSGLWQIGSSNLFAMVVLRLADGSEVEVPELAGRPTSVWHVVDKIQHTMGLPPHPTLRGTPQ